MFIVLLCIWMNIEASKCVQKPNVPECPTWTYPNKFSSQDECVCGSHLEGAVECSPTTLDVFIAPYYCMSYDQVLNTTVIGSCPYRPLVQEYHPALVPKEPSSLSSFICGTFHRRGQLCGECGENYTLSLYSYNLGCSICYRSQYNWVIFIAAAFLPLTVFYILVIMFRISVTSSSLNCYVLISQLFSTPAIMRQTYFANLHANSSRVSYWGQYIVDFGIAISAVWNLDFFRSFYTTICVDQRLTTYQILALDYVIAVYPLFLIFVTFALVKLHDNFSFVVTLWRPFHKCLVRFRNHFNIRSSLVNALATFIILSFIKILNASFDLLMPSTVYNIDGKSMNLDLYYDGTVKMASREYLPYLLLAVVMLLVFNILPLLLLTLYPFQCFQRFLNHCCLGSNHRLVLQTFMDAFQGCFKETPYDCRHFAALYLLMRLILPLLFISLGVGLFKLPASLVTVLLMALVIKFQPYKSKRSNFMDAILLFLLNCACLAYVEIFLDKALSQDKMFPNEIICGILALLGVVPPLYVVLLMMTKCLPSNCYKRIEGCTFQLWNKIISKREERLLEVVIDRGPDYNTF